MYAFIGIFLGLVVGIGVAGTQLSPVVQPILILGSAGWIVDTIKKAVAEIVKEYNKHS